MEVKNIEQTKYLAEILGKNIQEKGAFISLLGNIGVGKTAFARFLIKYFGIKETVTSPSFVILNEYKSKFFPIYHFDLYRLEENGIDSIKEELRECSRENVLTLVEWADFGQNQLPFEKMEIKIKCLEDETRLFELIGHSTYYKNIIERTTKEFYEHFNN